MAKLDARKSGTFKIGGGIKINRLGFGAMRITGQGIWGPPADRAEALRTLKRVPELGIDFIDTADSYGPDVSEQLIREALHPYNGIVVATKAGFQRPSPGVWEMDGRARALARAGDQELQETRRRADRSLAIAPHRSQSAAQGAVRRDKITDRRRHHPACAALRGVGRRYQGCCQGVPGGDGAEPLQSRRSRQRGRARLLRGERHRLHPVVSAGRRRARQARARSLDRIAKAHRAARARSRSPGC